MAGLEPAIQGPHKPCLLPLDGRVKPALGEALEIHRDPLPLPIAKARGFGAFRPAIFRRQLLFTFQGAACLGFGPGALARFRDAGGDFGVGCLIGHQSILHLVGVEKEAT